MNRRLLATAVLGLGVSVLSGCPGGYEAASRRDTPAAYRAYLRDDPDGAESDAARERLEDLEFEAAQKAHTVLAYKHFLEEFPRSEHIPTVLALLETLRWSAALSEGTEDAFTRFLHEHPDGAHQKEALMRLKRLQEEARSHETEPSRLKQALSAASERERPVLNARLDDLSFAAAQKKGTRELLEYLEEFPGGVHREEVQRSLLSRHLDGLLFSGLLKEADQERTRSPLGPQIADWPQRLARAQADQNLTQIASPLVPPTQPGYYLRSVEALSQVLKAPDPIDRWQAAEELGEQVSVAALDPLLESARTAKNPRIREAAFDALLHVVQALPPAIAEHELSVRLAARRNNVGSPELHAQVGALLELLGRLDEAAEEYQKGFDPHLPDPIVLWRFMTIRQAQHRPFSAAVAARQIGLWAKEVLEELGPETQGEGGHLSLAGIRQLCAVTHLVRLAHTGLLQAQKEEREFPEDVEGFLRESTELQRLSDAKLKDAELLLRAQDPQARTCDKDEVAERLAFGEQERGKALQLLPQKLPRWSRPLLERARSKDPSPYIRQLAATSLAKATAKP